MLLLMSNRGLTRGRKNQGMTPNPQSGENVHTLVFIEYF